ncbi:hypothetical protein HPB47_009895 [Ixodes persulcatus]|uniref:Uncharacterized protein n=1 Tax=Ixodes persulcatus TaxID=34615 RepID=A0AC60P0U8_IXOPE|nr:hypothetical protein HPB47_009895 [Ixodes persulcatus]
MDLLANMCCHLDTRIGSRLAFYDTEPGSEDPTARIPSSPKSREAVGAIRGERPSRGSHPSTADASINFPGPDVRRFPDRDAPVEIRGPGAQPGSPQAAARPPDVITARGLVCLSPVDGRSARRRRRSHPARARNPRPWASPGFRSFFGEWPADADNSI